MIEGLTQCTEDINESHHLGFGQLFRRSVLPDNVNCLAALGSSCVAVGTPDGVEIVSWNGSKCARVSGFSAECLVSIGSATLAAGDEGGSVRVWHFRRSILKEVHKVEVHSNPVRVLANGGDVMFTSSDNGTVRQLDTFADFSLTDFQFLAGQSVSCLATGGRWSFFVGCLDGQVVQVHRKNATTLRQIQVSHGLVALAINEEDGRLLAASDGRVQVWRFPVSGPARGREDPVLLGSYHATGVVSAVLLPQGGPENFLLASSGGVTRGPERNLSKSQAGESGVAGENCMLSCPAAAMVLASCDSACSDFCSVFVALGTLGSAGTQQKSVTELFEIVIPKVPDAKVDDSIHQNQEDRETISDCITEPVGGDVVGNACPMKDCGTGMSEFSALSGDTLGVGTKVASCIEATNCNCQFVATLQTFWKAG